MALGWSVDWGVEDWVATEVSWATPCGRPYGGGVERARGNRRTVDWDI